MQNASSNDKGPSLSKTFQEVSESMSEVVKQIIPEVGEKMSEKASEFSKKASDLANHAVKSVNDAYEDTSNWVRQNPNQLVGVFGAFLMGGALGFMIGKSLSKSSSEDRHSK